MSNHFCLYLTTFKRLIAMGAAGFKPYPSDLTTIKRGNGVVLLDRFNHHARGQHCQPHRDVQIICNFCHELFCACASTTRCSDLFRAITQTISPPINPPNCHLDRAQNWSIIGGQTCVRQTLGSVHFGRPVQPKRDASSRCPTPLSK